MHILSAGALVILLLVLGLVLHSGFCLASNYFKALKVGVPIRVLPINHNNPIWMLLDRPVLAFVRHLPFGLGDNSFTRYNFRAWEIHDRYRSHHEMGDVWMHVTPVINWLYVGDPETVTEIWKRGRDFPRETTATGEYSFERKRMICARTDLGPERAQRCLTYSVKT